MNPWGFTPCECGLPGATCTELQANTRQVPTLFPFSSHGCIHAFSLHSFILKHWGGRGGGVDFS